MDDSERTNATRRKEADEGLFPYLDVDTLHMWQQHPTTAFPTVYENTYTATMSMRLLVSNFQAVQIHGHDYKLTFLYW